MEDIYNLLTELITSIDAYRQLWLIFVFIVIDILTGVIIANILKKYKSSIMREGVMKKSLWLFVWALGFSIYKATTFNGFMLLFNVCIIYTELMSISENLKKVGINLPWSKFLKEEKDNE